LKDLIIDVEDLPEHEKKDFNIDLKLEVDREKKEFHSLRVPLIDWKRRILEKYNSQKIDYIVTEKSEEAGGGEIEKYRKVIIDSNDSPYIMIDKETKDTIKTKTFMKFKVIPLPKPNRDPADSENYEKLKNSFEHELTAVGKMALSRLKKNLSISYSSWKTNFTNYAAPLVSFCQSSGSGKSKLSVEMLKLYPGFYFVFREPDQTGYPRANSFSNQIIQIIKGYDDKSSSQSNLQYLNSTVGKILDYFSRILVSYVRNICSLVRKQESLGSLDLEKNLEHAIHEIGSLFLDNETVETNFPIISREEVEKIYLRFGESITVENVAKFFYTALIYPEKCLESMDSREDKAICQLLLDKYFSKFPFLFVLDEADILSSFKIIPKDLDRKVSGLEIIKRALGYVRQDTDSLFLTLGTKSDVFDINPPMIDFSAHLLNRISRLDPITLTSNSNIFSKDYPISGLSPTYALIRNPFFFKFICTLGHSLWSSYPFNEIVPIALKKLKNASAGSNEYFLPIWMIRTGLATNPLHKKGNSLVEGHMATLHNNVQENFIVSYPSEPILAIASRIAMTVNENGKPLYDDASIFDILKDNTEAVSLDIGRFAEVFGAMIILRAIDKTPNFTRIYSSYKRDEILDEIKKLTPVKFHTLWEKESQLLEVPAKEASSREVSSTDRGPDITVIQHPRFLEHYRVNRVCDFLKTLINTDDLDKFGIPKSILNGIVNATHFVSLTRDNTGFIVNNFDIKPSNLPLADDRIANSSRNIIDTALLKIGLLRQCGFSMPSNYYGLDFILPVCLENNDLTFIGIQIKRSDANMSEDVYKMRSRLHLVKCPNSCTNPKTCDFCLSNETLRNIHGNHLSLLLSLDDDSNLPKFSHDNKFHSKITNRRDHDILLKTLTADAVKSKISGLSVDAKSDSFLKPLVQKNIMIKEDVAIASSLWDDRHVKLPLKSKEDINSFIPDPWVHRQYTLMTRGWNVFGHLFNDYKNVIKIANNMISNDGMFRHIKQRSDPQLVRCVVYDTAPSYVQYSDELLAMRGKEESYLEILDSLELKSSVNESEIAKLVEKLDKNLVISPPESPKK
jgi:hypothetical protein